MSKRRSQGSYQPRRPAGRPKHFDLDALMATWLFVEEGRRRLGLSVNAFCKRAHLRWVTGGRPAPDQVRRDIKTGTLRRRYQEAQAFLKDENRPYLELKNLLAAENPQFDGVSPAEMWWRQVLQERLATSK